VINSENIKGIEGRERAYPDGFEPEDQRGDKT